MEPGLMVGTRSIISVILVTWMVLPAALPGVAPEQSTPASRSGQNRRVILDLPPIEQLQVTFPSLQRALDGGMLPQPPTALSGGC